MIKWISIGILLLCTGEVMAQSIDPKKAYRIEGSDIVLYLSGDWSRIEQQHVLERSGMKNLSLDTLWKFGSIGHLAREGWKVTNDGKGHYKIYKSISDLSGHVHWDKELIVFNDLLEETKKQTFAVFGNNSFKRQSVFPMKNGNRRFFLAGKLAAREVYLSGTFNSWSTLRTPMAKTDSGWVVDLELAPGKHQYKFIVDGRWMTDPWNLKHEDNFHGDLNSVYFVTNYEFNLAGYQEAKEVTVSGNFNNWNEREIPLRRKKDGWSLPVYLREGNYTYHYIVDRKTFINPAMPTKPSVKKTEKNATLNFGDPVYFNLKGYSNAQKVILSGNFNKWKTKELVMKRNATGWELAHVLPPGNYQYKFIVDGQWITDPANTNYAEEDGFTNSLMIVQPNHTFFLKGYTTARNVQVAGNFNGWKGYQMRRTDNGWTISLYIAPGKCLYKLVVDDQWITDPGNEFWEQNEYGTGNSVLWKN
jgi:Glycogen recognition site of AMP-activated protein kinase/Carbohydrate-binding module 48 (Isoamylase N-terminal domain)